MINKDRLINLFMELVQIDSISKEERDMADRLIEIFKTLDLQAREDNAGEKIGGNAGNLIIDIPGDMSRSSVVLSAHMDRVEPGRGIKPVLDENYIKSDGTTILGGDDLIGVAAIIEAVRVLKENNLKHRPIKLILTVAEEIGLMGAKQVDVAEFEDMDFGLVFDVDGDIGTVVHKAPTQIKFNARINGKAAHAGINPSEGINAIKIASLSLSEMNLGQVDEETTANIGVIKGGIASNIVPDMVELEGEVRSHSYNKMVEQQNHMQNLIKRAVKKYGGSVSFDIDELYPGFAINPESDIIKYVEEIVEDMDLEFKLTVSGGGSDANIFNNNGFDTLNLGVGMEKVHSTQERVKIDNLVNLTSLIINVLTNYNINYSKEK
ncbi:MAG: M20/M25/M40 family metallo-hydrolase [Halanaerobiaceae bacterium]